MIANCKHLSAACCPGAEPLGFLGDLHGPPDTRAFFLAFKVYLRNEGDLCMFYSLHAMYA